MVLNTPLARVLTDLMFTADLIDLLIRAAQSLSLSFTIILRRFCTCSISYEDKEIKHR